MRTCGIDCGSETLKIVLCLDGEVKWLRATYDSDSLPLFVEKTVTGFLKEEGLRLKDLEGVVATGVGRKAVSFADRNLPEFFCLAKAIEKLFPSAGTAIDGGAKNLTAIRCKEGKVSKFLTNTRCASGTGVFLKIVAEILCVSIDDLDRLYFLSQNPCDIQSTCAVFTESEIISLVHQRKSIEDIARGAIWGLSGRIAALLMELGIGEDIAFSGGIARMKSVVSAVEERLQKSILVPEDPDVVNAFGASLIAGEMIHKG